MPGHTSTVHWDQSDKLTEEQVNLILEDSLQGYHRVLQQFGFAQDVPAFVPHRPVDKMEGDFFMQVSFFRGREHLNFVQMEGVGVTPSFRSWLEGEKVRNLRLLGMQAIG
ncbi:hypothetical protein AMTRI_Chr03g141680 [Amborella trichopoda]